MKKLPKLMLDLNLYRQYKKQPFLLALILFRSQNSPYGGCFASYESMAADLRARHNTIVKGIKVLLEDGMIEFVGWHNRCHIIRPTAKTIKMMNTISIDDSLDDEIDDLPELPEIDEFEVSGEVQETPAHMEDSPRHIENLPRHMENVPHVLMENLPHIKNSVKENKEKESVCVYTPRTEEPKKEVPEVTQHTHKSFYSSRSSRKFTRKPSVPESLEKVIEYAREHGGTEAQARKFYMYYASTGWRNSRGVAISNWQMTLDFWVAQDKEKAEAKRVNEHKIHCNGHYGENIDRALTQAELDDEAAFDAMWEAEAYIARGR